MTVSDPLINAWTDANGENADECAWNFGPTYATGNGATGAEGGLGGARGGNTLNRPTTRSNSDGYGSPSTGMGSGNNSTVDPQGNGTSNSGGSTGSYTSPNDTQSGNGH